MNVLSWSDFLNEDNSTDIAATHLIGQDGTVKAIKGIIKPTKGIYDESGKRYVAAIGSDGKIYTSLPDINTIVTYVAKGTTPDRETTRIATVGGGLLDMPV